MNTPSSQTLIEFLTKAYELTTQALKFAQNQDFDSLFETLENRERAISIAQTMSERLALEQTKMDKRLVTEMNNQVNQIIEKIASMDDIITMCLTEERNKTQVEIAKTFKNKENFKGYNLNKVE